VGRGSVSVSYRAIGSGSKFLAKAKKRGVIYFFLLPCDPDIAKKALYVNTVIHQKNCKKIIPNEFTVQ
jgi:hypothetical protein